MNARTSGGWTWVLVIALSACSNLQPGDSSTASAPEVQIKKIDTLNPRAAVVLDKNCPDLVQPYRLTDNVASIASFNVTELTKMLPSRIGSMFSSKSALNSTSDKLSASSKMAAKQLNWLPMTAEELYGKRRHEERTDILSRDSKIGRRHYPLADEMLEDILAAVDKPHDYDFKLFILKSSGRNALALPGGYLYLDQGLLDSPARHPKARFALAHEVAHVLQRHETKEMQSLVVDSFTVRKDLLDMMKGARSNPLAVVDRIQLEKSQFTRHHVDQELQADSCAVKILTRVLGDPKALVATLDAFLQDLPPTEATPPAMGTHNKAEGAIEDLQEIVSSPIQRHPNTRERMENLRAIYSEVVGTPRVAK